METKRLHFIKQTAVEISITVVALGVVQNGLSAILAVTILTLASLWLTVHRLPTGAAHSGDIFEVL